MSFKHKKLDTSNELLICRFNQGIKLVRPDEIKFDAAHLTNHTLGSIQQLPFSFYLLDLDGATKKMNSEGVEICGFESVEHSIGKTIGEVSKKESAIQMLNNCHEVINSHNVKIFDEENWRKDGERQHFLSVKSPWYDQSNKIVGICGFTVAIGKHSLANSLSIITDLGLLNPQKQIADPFADQANGLNLNAFHLKGINLTKRERECLCLTVKGYTAKRIARELDISHRTVEEYITNIRIKIGVSTKSELIEIVMNNFKNT